MEKAGMEEAGVTQGPVSGGEDHAAAEKEMTLLECALIVHARRRLILGAAGGAVLLALVVSLCLPNVYRSTATIITPQEGGSDLSSFVALSGVAQTMTGLSLPSLTPNRDLFVSILNSRTLREATVKAFNFRERFGKEQLSEAVRELERMVTVSVSQEGVISIVVEDTHPQLAADVANFQVATLGRMVLDFKTTAAGTQRAFITNRLEKTKGELDAAEDALRAFKVERKLVGMDEQAKGLAEVVRDLSVQIAEYEAQLEFYRENFSASNPELQRLESLLNEKKRQLSELQYGTLPASANAAAGSLGGGVMVEDPDEKIYVPIVKLPQVGLELARLTRDVVHKNAVYTLLVQELERARISEAREVLELQVLDTAVPADRKSRPNILLNTVIAGFLGLFIGVFLSFLLEYGGRIKGEFRAFLMAKNAALDPFDPSLPAEVSRAREEGNAPKRGRRRRRFGRAAPNQQRSADPLRKERARD